MPGTLKVRVHSARDLPVMNAASQLTTAYATVKLDSTTHKTEICRKTLNPVWNADFRFEVDDEALQDEILLVKLWDYDPMGGDDPIGQVMIDLDALTKWDAPGQISGWFPIFDTLRGIRGSIEITIKVELFRDQNRYRDTSCGVLVFSSTVPPECYTTLSIIGFVEELMLKVDPEFQWMDRIRTARASNEARQAVFAELDGELQRKIGLKVLELGGNAVLGYRQEFDLEGNAMVARGIGTVAILSSSKLVNSSSHDLSEQHLHLSVPPHIPVDRVMSTQSTIDNSPVGSWDQANNDSRRPSGSLNTALGVSPSQIKHHRQPRTSSAPRASRSVELITLTRFPAGFLVSLGAIVKACSIKLAEDEKVETRDTWWNELRSEIRSHAQILGFSAVIGYSETTSIEDGVCLLTAIGTAAVINSSPIIPKMTSQSRISDKRSSQSWRTALFTTGPITEPLVDFPLLTVDGNTGESPRSVGTSSNVEFGASETARADCPFKCFHLPFASSVTPFFNSSKHTLCKVCGSARVPELLLCTVDPPCGVPVVGPTSYIQARVCRVQSQKKVGKADFAIQVGAALPFVEHELHQQLINKLKISGGNAVFGLRMQVSVGESLIVAVASGTAAYMPAIAPLPELQILRNAEVLDEEDKQYVALQNKLITMAMTNRKTFQAAEARAISSGVFQLSAPSTTATTQQPSNAMQEEPQTRIQRNVVVQVDDEVDEESMNVMFETPTPDGLFACTTDFLPGLNQLNYVELAGAEIVTVIKRVDIDTDKQVNQTFADVFKQIFGVAWFKLRHMKPCVLSNIRFEVQLPDDREILVTMNAMVVSLGEAEAVLLNDDEYMGAKRPSSFASSEHLDRSPPTPIFPIDDISKSTPPAIPGDSMIMNDMDLGSLSNSIPQIPSSMSEQKHIAPPPSPATTRGSLGSYFNFDNTARDDRRLDEVVITPMAHVPGRRMLRQLGTLSLYLIKETTSAREVGGVAGFLQLFMSEVHAIAKAHVVSRGGNALVFYRLKQPVLLDNPGKNQAQALLSVTGDIVEVSAVKSSKQNRGKSTGRSRTLSVTNPFEQVPASGAQPASASKPIPISIPKSRSYQVRST